MNSEKAIIVLKDLSKIYQMGEEISVKALDNINLGHFHSQYSRILSKVVHAFIPYLAVAK